MNIKKTLTIATIGLVGSINAFNIIKDSKPLATIYINDFNPEAKVSELWSITSKDTAQEQKLILNLAIKDLNYHLKKMSDVELPIAVKEKIKYPAIVIKWGNELQSEKFQIKVTSQQINIIGDSRIACAYAIYELLEKLGCDWVMPGKTGEVIPRRKTVAIGEMDDTQTPSFAVRAPWISGNLSTLPKSARLEFLLWKIRHKEQINGQWTHKRMVGGHTWGDIFLHNKELWEKNPEFLALVRQIDGSMIRQGPQLESVNPKVINLMADYIRSVYSKNKWSKNREACISMGPADGLGFSESSESRIAGSGRVDPVTGYNDTTDLLVLLCNQLIEKLGKEYPNLYLGFYLYSSHADYPMRYKPDPKVLVCIADINYSRLHGIFDEQSKTRFYYKNILEQWGRLHKEQGNLMHFRGYNWNLAENFLPYTKLKIWGKDIPYYHKLGVTSIYNEYSSAWSVNGPSDYLEAKLTWNVNLNWKEVLKGYCLKAFGNGGPFMEKYYLNLAETQSENSSQAGSYYSFSLLYDEIFLKKSRQLINKALSLAQMPEQKKRIKYAGIPIEALDIFLRYYHNTRKFKFVEAKKDFDQLKEYLKANYKQNKHLVSTTAIYYLNRFNLKTIESAVKYSTGKYKIFFKLPDSLKTEFDSSGLGYMMNFQSPKVKDDSYLMTKTYSSTWDAQGLNGYKGAVWYRVHFNAQANKQLGLYLGCIDSVVRVWCNGKYIGMGQGFSIPHEFDLSETLKNGDNLLSIQVIHNGSEIGVGGLLFPSFIFEGPRLKIKTPKVKKIIRVLPGGGIG